MATLGTHPFLDIVISYFGTTVPSPDRVHEHNAARTTTTQMKRTLSIETSI
jgi:hypothetical protein